LCVVGVCEVSGVGMGVGVKGIGMRHGQGFSTDHGCGKGIVGVGIDIRKPQNYFFWLKST
jgi:hypothetical protein